MNKRLRYQALLIGHHVSLMRALPKLLNRAGFEVDIITTDPRYVDLRPVRRAHFATDRVSLIAIATKFSYVSIDLVVICDDEILIELVRSNLNDDLKLKLLPVCSIDNFVHLGTKIGLSNLLRTSGILTPEFTVANDIDELRFVLKQIPHAVLLKNDLSAGGVGVFPYSPGGDVNDLLKRPIYFPLLIQEYIEGDVIDLSAFYQDGDLIHFSYAIMNSFANNQFGPSIVRTYKQLSTVPIEVFEQLRSLGRALGAHGFVNITCLRDHRDGRHYFIEADMRPNIWVDYAQYLGDDLAQAVRKYFDFGTIFDDSQPLRVGYPEQLKIPHVYRLSASEILTNQHNVWRFCREYSVAEILIRALKLLVRQHIKPKLSEKRWLFLKKVFSFAGLS